MTPSMKKSITMCVAALMVCAGIGTAHAWRATGMVFCDVNQNQEADLLDLALQDVAVMVQSLDGLFTGFDYTMADGSFSIALQDFPDSYRESLDGTTLPADTIFVNPSTNEHLFTLTDAVTSNDQNWLIDSATCRQGGTGCRVTGGGNDTSGIDPVGGWDETFAQGSSRRQGGINRYTFGGQAGANTALPPQPKGEWTHHQQSGPDGSFVFHAGTASAPPGTEIDEIICSDRGYCNPARPAPNKQIDFEGAGTFKNINKPSAALAGVVPGETYHWFDVHIEDLGEPGNEPTLHGNKKNRLCPNGGSGTDAFADPPVFLPGNCGCADFYRIRIYAGVIPVFDPTTGEVTNFDKTNVIYQVAGYIDGGNLQIHPPTGFDLK
jgi:hypothetical protein